MKIIWKLSATFLFVTLLSGIGVWLFEPTHAAREDVHFAMVYPPILKPDPMEISHDSGNHQASAGPGEAQNPVGVILLLPQEDPTRPVSILEGTNEVQATLQVTATRIPVVKGSNRSKGPAFSRTSKLVISTPTGLPATATPVPSATQRINPTLTQVLITTATNTATPTVTEVFIPTATNAATVPATTCTVGSNSSYEIEVISLLNQERINNGVPALATSTSLSVAAQGHSRDMACNNFMSHTGSNGSSFTNRLSAAGYSFSDAAENVAAGYGSPAEVVAGWMNSPGHRANILDPNLTQVGIGYAYSDGSTFGDYWTADFGSP